MIVFKIDEYEVMYSSNKYPPSIWLKSAGKFIGQLIFKPDGSSLTADNNSNGINLHYHLADFMNALDILRNEKPVYLLWSAAISENGVKTASEPVGEAKIAPKKHVLFII